MSHQLLAPFHILYSVVTGSLMASHVQKKKGCFELYETIRIRNHEMQAWSSEFKLSTAK
jgi:hypothetical protein